MKKENILVSADEQENEANELFVNKIEWNKWTLFLKTILYFSFCIEREKKLKSSCVLENMLAYDIRNSIESQSFDMLSACNHEMR